MNTSISPSPSPERIIFIKADEGIAEYSRSFTPYIKEFEEAKERIKTASATAFQHISAFFSALAAASYDLFFSIIPSFVWSVLGLGGGGLPSTIELLFFNTLYWAGSLTFTTVASIYRKMSDQLGWTFQNSQSVLASFSKNLDTRHIRTDEIELEASHVPDTVKVKLLLEMFEKINFDDQTKAGYVQESRRKEGQTSYTPAELKKYLIDFTDKVTNNIAFLGTPPGHDIAAVEKFYRQIRAAVRLSIYKSNEDLQAFKDVHPEDPATYKDAILTEYKNILEDRSGLVIDLAIAGAHCGARFMSDSMQVHDTFYGAANQQHATLEAEIVAALANKRKEIVLGMIESKKNDPAYFGLGSSHNYTEHMALLGEILALPGTSGVVEHLSHHLSREERLRTFFTSYTQDTIINTINEKWQDPKSGDFRDKIYDWLKGLSGDWNKEKYDQFLKSAKIEALQEKLSLLKTSSENITAGLALKTQKLNSLVSLLKALKPHLSYLMTDNDGAVKPLTTANWDDFLCNRLLTNESNRGAPTFKGKQEFRNNISNNLSERAKLITEMRTIFSKNSLGEDLVEHLVAFATGEVAEFNSPLFEEKFSENLKYETIRSGVRNLFSSMEESDIEAEKVLSSVAIEDSYLERFAEGKLSGKEFLEILYGQVRRNEFIQNFRVDGDNQRYEDLLPANREQAAYQPLPPALLELLLVSHKILAPQSVEKGMTTIIPIPIHEETSHELSDKEDTYITSMLKEGYLPKNNRISLEALKEQIFNSADYSDADYKVFQLSINQIDETLPKRYAFPLHLGNPRKEAMDELFNEAFKNNPEAIIAEAERLEGEGTQFYSSWKKAFVIDLPKTIEGILSYRVELVELPRRPVDPEEAPQYTYPVRTAIQAVSFILGLSAFGYLHSVSSAVLHNTVIPFAVSLIPPGIASFISACVVPIFNFIRERTLAFAFLGVLTVGLINRRITQNENMPPEVQRIAVHIRNAVSLFSLACLSLAWPASTWFTGLLFAGRMAINVGAGLERLSAALKNHVESAENERFRVCKAKAYAAWLKIVDKTTPVADAWDDVTRDRRQLS